MLLFFRNILQISNPIPISISESPKSDCISKVQKESELDWRAYSRILQCKNRPPQPSFRDLSQIIIQSNQELQLATEEGSFQSNPTSIRSNPDSSILVSPEPSNEQQVPSHHRHIFLEYWELSRSIDQTISRVKTNPNPTRMKTGDYST
ncbi:hypothetical protein ACTFIR_012803 [Dictyostelium discoideum]